ncbi:hypothetical protein BDQ17DRAFT_524750 [Cyathus striatus]|nr:hypothetical protein BDQ17DRAFT_524750 [Cyathus striatus]
MSKNDSSVVLEPAVVDEDTAEPPVSVPDSGDAGEGGKLKMIVQLVKKCLGVKDIASMRLSLPASLLEPIPNLEYWHYLDRPDLFATLGIVSRRWRAHPSNSVVALFSTASRT